MLPLLLILALLAPPQRAVTADPSNPKRTQVAPASTWAASNGPSASDPFTAVTLIESNADASAMLTVSELNELELATHDGSSWSSLDTLTSDVGGTSGFYADGAYEARSGRLLVVYRKGVSSQVYFRVHDSEASPELSSEDWYDLALPSAPARLLLAPRPGSDEILLVAVSGATIRTALWDGTDFTDPTTQETVFDNGPEAVAAVWQNTEALVVWARDADTTPRAARFDGTDWNAELGLPSCVHPIARLELAPSSDRATRPLLLTAVTFDGADYALRVAVRDDSAWSGVSTLSSALAGADAASAAWQPSGVDAAAVWQASGATTLSVSHYEDTGWSPPVTTSDLGGTADRVLARPATGQSGSVRTMATVSIEPESSGGYVAYTNGGSIETGSGTTIDGETDEGGAGFPDTPSGYGSAGGPTIDLNNNQTKSYAPGGYEEIDIGNNATLNLSSGDYALEKWGDKPNGLTMNADTASGPIRVVVVNDNVEFHNNLEINVSGSHPITFYILNGNLEVSNNFDVHASFVVYNGNIEIGNNADVSGHLIASGNIEIGNNGQVESPGWPSPMDEGGGGGEGIPTQALVGLTVTAGLPGSPTTIVDNWAETHTLPFDLGWQRPTAGLRITSWREVPSYDPAP